MGLRWIGFVSYWIQVVGISAAGLTVPAAVSIANHLAISVDDYQWMILSKTMMYPLSMLVFSVLADWMGRKKTLVSVSVMLCVSAVIFLTSSNVFTWWLAELLSGLVLGSTAMLSRLIISDVFSGDQLRVRLSFRTTFSQLLLTVTPVVSGWIVTSFGWEWIFITIAGLSILLLVSALLTPETNVVETEEGDQGLWALAKQFFGYLTSPYVFWVSSIATGAICCVSVWLTTSPVVLMSVYHFDAQRFGQTILLVNLFPALLTLINGYFVLRYGALQLLQTASLGLLAASVTMFTVVVLDIALPWQLAMVSAVIFFASLCGTNATVYLVSYFKQQTHASLSSVLGANICIAFLGVGLGALPVSWVLETSLLPAATTFLVSALWVMFVVWYVILKRFNRRS